MDATATPTKIATQVDAYIALRKEIAAMDARAKEMAPAIIEAMNADNLREIVTPSGECLTVTSPTAVDYPNGAAVAEIAAAAVAAGFLTEEAGDRMVKVEVKGVTREISKVVKTLPTTLRDRLTAEANPKKQYLSVKQS
jgi:hypothetical protein